MQFERFFFRKSPDDKTIRENRIEIRSSFQWWLRIIHENVTEEMRKPLLRYTFHQENEIAQFLQTLHARSTRSDTIYPAGANEIVPLSMYHSNEPARLPHKNPAKIIISQNKTHIW